MEKDSVDIDEVRLLSGQLFDRFANERRAGQLTHDTVNRAVAAASILAFTLDGPPWFEVLDEALGQRGIETKFSDQTPRFRNGMIRSSNSVRPRENARCKTIPGLLRELNRASKVD